MILFYFVREHKKSYVTMECYVDKINYSSAFVLSKRYPMSLRTDIVNIAGLLQDSVLKTNYNIIDYPPITTQNFKKINYE